MIIEESQIKGSRFYENEIAEISPGYTGKVFGGKFLDLTPDDKTDVTTYPEVDVPIKNEPAPGTPFVIQSTVVTPPAIATEGKIIFTAKNGSIINHVKYYHQQNDPDVATTTTGYIEYTLDRALTVDKNIVV